jgi:hypothetical protein
MCTSLFIPFLLPLLSIFKLSKDFNNNNNHSLLFMVASRPMQP